MESFDEPSQEFGAEQFRQCLAELGMSNGDLAARMKRLGDPRSVDAIVRSLQRMLGGQVRVSGEMAVVANLLSREKLRFCQKARSLRWSAKNGHFEARTDGFEIILIPQTKGRWKISLKDTATGYCPPWPNWQSSLDGAKERAMLAVDDGLIELEENHRDQQRAA